MRKYELIPCKTNYLVKRVKALRSFSDVKEGDIGGMVYEDFQLSHDGDCWLYDDAVIGVGGLVSGDAKIRDNARIIGSEISGNAIVRGSANVLDHCRVSGNAIVEGDSLLNGSSRDKVLIHGNALVRGDAVITGPCDISDDVVVDDNAELYSVKVTGKSHIQHNCKVYGGINREIGVVDNVIIFDDFSDMKMRSDLKDQT